MGRKPVSSSQGPQPSGPQSLHLPDGIQGLCPVLRLSCHCPSSGLPSASGWSGGKHLGFAPETCLHSPGPRGPTPGPAAAPPGASLLGAPLWPRALSRDRWLGQGSCATREDKQTWPCDLWAPRQDLQCKPRPVPDPGLRGQLSCLLARLLMAPAVPVACPAQARIEMPRFQRVSPWR